MTPNSSWCGRTFSAVPVQISAWSAAEQHVGRLYEPPEFEEAGKSLVPQADD